jgi:membrane protein implicated in regulation of membrane protease activity
MAGVLKLLAVSEKDVEIGEITGKRADGRYKVSVKGQTIRASALGVSPSVGDRVVIARTSDGPQIVSKQPEKGRSVREVIIDG